MGRVLSMICCPFHPDDTASLAIYADGWAHCYGCEKHVPVEQLGMTVERDTRPKYVEDVRARLEEIQKLPTRPERGLRKPFHYDGRGFYLIWPNAPHYKRRNYDGKPKYKGPSGVKTPMFEVRVEGTERLIAVEGELNALSVAEAVSGVDVVSPGSASDMNGPRFEYDRVLYRRYREVLVITDYDRAGVTAGIELAGVLNSLVPRVTLKCVNNDANSILMDRGPHALKEEIDTYLEMPRGVSRDQEPL